MTAIFASDPVARHVVAYSGEQAIFVDRARVLDLLDHTLQLRDGSWVPVHKVWYTPSCPQDLAEALPNEIRPIEQAWN